MRIDDGFFGDASLFRYRATWETAATCMRSAFGKIPLSSGDDIVYAINIPQESVTIPETMDGIRAAMGMQTDRLEAVGLTTNTWGLEMEIKIKSLKEIPGGKRVLLKLDINSPD